MNATAAHAPQRAMRNRRASSSNGRRQRALTNDPTQTLGFVRDPLRLLLFVLTVVTISRVHQHYPVLTKFRPALLLVLASAGYAYLHPAFLTRARIFKLWPMRLLMALALLSCCSAAFGISLGRSASFILDSFGKTLLYGFLMALSIRHVRDLYTFVWAYVVSCGILAFFSIFVFGLRTASNSYVARLNDLYTYDSNDLGVIMMIGLALTLLLLIVTRGGRRWLVLVNLVAICAAIARSGSRGAFIGFAVTGVAALFVVNNVPATRRTLLLSVAVLSLAIGAPPGYWKQMGTLLQPEQDYNFSSRDGRKALFERGLGYVAQYPIFGLGIDNFARAECTISPKIATIGNARLRCTVPHNSYVQAGTELGIPGFFVWLALVVGGIVAPLRLRRRLPRWWRRGTEVQRFLYGATSFLPLAMLGFAVTSFFVSFAWMDPLYLLAAFLTGFYVSLQAYLNEAGPAAGGVMQSESTGALAPGWRVTRSARHGHIATPPFVSWGGP
ncbi:MAG TPA: O-antigen ligase family protein [Gemmatimonadaceae bacterium]